MTMESLRIREPLLEFGHGQRMEAPKDGLFLFGPLEGTAGRSQVRIGVVGTDSGAGLSRRWLQRIGVHIPGKLNRQGHPTTWAPDWPGFETTFELAMPKHAMVEIGLTGTEIERCIKRSNRADAVRSTVLLFAEAIRAHLRNEERRPDVWLVVVPDVVYRYGRPQVAPPPRDERTQSAILSSKEAKRFFQQGGDLFPDTMRDAETYLFSSNFHHQLKAELLQDRVVIQLVLESTLIDRSLGGTAADPVSYPDAIYPPYRCGSPHPATGWILSLRCGRECPGSWHVVPALAEWSPEYSARHCGGCRRR